MDFERIFNHTVEDEVADAWKMILEIEFVLAHEDVFGLVKGKAVSKLEKKTMEYAIMRQRSSLYKRIKSRDEFRGLPYHEIEFMPVDDEDAEGKAWVLSNADKSKAASEGMSFSSSMIFANGRTAAE
jgi:hypothetical protein